MRAGWETKKLGEMAAINYGFTQSASNEPVGPKFLRITDIQNDQVDWDSVPYCKLEPEDFKKFRLNGGDIVFARTGATTGKSFLVCDPPEAVFASYLIRLRLLDERLMPEFVSRFFQTSGYWRSIEDGSSGSAQGGFNASKLGELSIPIPPIAEQQRIVAILDEAFAGIATATANAEKNLQNARELFESTLQSVFAEKGELWEEKYLGEIAKLINGKAYKKPELLSEGKYPVLRVGNFFTNKNWYYSDLELPEDKYCDNGDLLYAWSASFGPRIWDGGKVIYHYHIWKVIPDPTCVTKEFLFNLFLWDMEKIKKEQGAGTTMIHVSMKSMNKRVVPVPPLNEQQLIVNRLSELSKRTKYLEEIYKKKLNELEELKQSILQKAFAGELH